MSNQTEDKTEEILESAKLTYPALTMDSTKQELIDHIIDVHNHGKPLMVNWQRCSKNAGTKATKEDLIKHHDLQHKVLDDPEREHPMNGDVPNESMWSVTNESGYVTRVAAPAIDHVHAKVEVDPELAAAAEAIRENKSVTGRPVQPREQKALHQLVDNDFAALKSEMQAFSADMLNDKRNEINAEWDAKVAKAAKFVERAGAVKRRHYKAKQELAEKQAIEWEAIQAEAKAAGLTLTQKQRKVAGSDTEEIYFEAEAQGRSDALNEATKENKRYLDRALMSLERQRLDAQRRVLVSSISPEAAKILDTIPDAQSMMITAKNLPKELSGE